MSTTLKSYNPANGQIVGEVPVTPLTAIPHIITRAQAALMIWRAIAVEERADMLKNASDKLLERAKDLGELLSREMGKPLTFAIGEVTYCADQIPQKVDEIVKALQPVVTETDSIISTRYYDPLGVVGVISPWNYPMSMLQWMTLPALMAGNTVVIKPSEETPLIAEAYADILIECLPKDVLHVVHGDEEQGKALVNADINLITFTGSRNAGIHIMKSAAKDLKRIILELGGKDPLIVLEDADLEAAAAFAVENSFENSGQACISTERIYVHHSVAEEFEQLVLEKTQALKLPLFTDDDTGTFARRDGAEDHYRSNGKILQVPPDADIGPMINNRQCQHVINQIADAVQKGARILCGGTEHPECFVMPTVLSQCTDDMVIMQEETFGPVACIARFNTTEEAIERANNSIYGLGAAVFGKDEEIAYHVARQIDAGMIGVNKSCFATPDSPWIGAKQSGYSYHGSIEGHHNYTQIRVVSRAKGG